MILAYLSGVAIALIYIEISNIVYSADDVTYKEFGPWQRFVIAALWPVALLLIASMWVINKMK